MLLCFVSSSEKNGRAFDKIRQTSEYTEYTEFNRTAMRFYSGLSVFPLCLNDRNRAQDRKPWGNCLSVIS